jgi:hypothetical protein
MIDYYYYQQIELEFIILNTSLIIALTLCQRDVSKYLLGNTREW